MTIKLKLDNKGFTLIEFLLASAVFSFFLVLIMVSFLQINRSYNRGVTVKEVQQAARIVLEDISRSLQSSYDNGNPDILGPSTTGLAGYRLCAGEVQYSWNGINSGNLTEDTYNSTNEQFTMVKSVKGNNCIDKPEKLESTVVVDGNLKVQSLSINPVSSLSSVYSIDLVLSTDEDDDAFVDQGTLDAACTFSANGSVSRESAKQYCSVVKVSTAVSIRK